jgi:hypothetical protein
MIKIVFFSKVKFLRAPMIPYQHCKFENDFSIEKLSRGLRFNEFQRVEADIKFDNETESVIERTRLNLV